MMKDIPWEKWLDSFMKWGHDYFWSADSLINIVIAITAFAMAAVIYRFISKPILDAIEKWNTPYQAKRVSRNLTRQIVAVLTLLMIFLATQILNAIGLESQINNIVMKLLLAWVLIRTCLQFVMNQFVRNIFAVSIWIVAALSIFGVLDETLATLDAIGINIGDFRLSALAVIKGAITIFLLLYLAGLGSSFIERSIFKTQSLTRSSQVLIAKIIRVSFIVIALFIGITTAGIDLSLFAVFGGAIGLGIGFGLQKVISNLFSGMLLLMDQSIKPGDVIEMENGTFGWVNSMAARHTEIVTRDNKSFLIPNEDFITQRVVNWSHGNTLIRLQVTFGVSYEHNPHEVKRIAEEGVKGCNERVCEDPAPICHLTDFGESSLDFKLNFWIKDAEQGVTNVRGEVMLALWDAFQENNINIPYPHREVYVHQPAKAKPKPRKKVPAKKKTA